MSTHSSIISDTFTVRLNSLAFAIVIGYLLDMARKAKAAELGSAYARRKLTRRPKPYSTKLTTGLFLDYYRALLDGTWYARRYTGAGKYERAFLGLADDEAAANGTTLLTFDQAHDAARAWFKQKAAADAGDVIDGPYTVAQAVADYMTSMESRKGYKQMLSIVAVHITPSPIAQVQLSKLRHSAVRAWLDSVAEAAPRVRAKVKGAVAHRIIDPRDPDAQRKRLATANRIWTVLRAALNYAHAHNRVPSKGAWDKVKPFREADAPKVRYLTVDESKRLIEACPADFGQLVLAALQSGCRYGELIAMRVGDFIAEPGQLHITRSKSGKARYVPLTEEGAAFFANLTSGRPARSLMFVHAAGQCEGEGWEATQQTHHMGAACRAAKIEPAVGFHVLRHTYASLLAMEGVGMPVIAQALGHIGDTRMVERHYAHLSTSHVAEQVRAHLPSFASVERKGIVFAKKADSLISKRA